MLTLYFSGTGNSKYVAELFADKMGGNCISIEEKADFGGLIQPEERIAFVYPIYLSRVPRIMREFVKTHRTQLHGKKLVILCTQMEFSGDGARCFTDLLPRGSYEVAYAEHIDMPNNVNNMRVFSAASEEKIERLLVQMQEKLKRICADIRAGVVVKRGFNPLSRLLGAIQGVIEPLFEWMMKRGVRIGGDCTGCGLCVQRCPMGNLTLADGKATAGKNCTLCYRCLNLCPQRTINIFFRGKVK